MVDSEDRLRLVEWDRNAFASRSDLNYEFRIRLADGQVRWLHQQAKVTYNDGGQPIRMVGTIQDITERKQIELALQKSTQLLHELQAIANLGSWTADLRTEISMRHRKVRALWGGRPDFTPAMSWWMSSTRMIVNTCNLPGKRRCMARLMILNTVSF